MHIRTILHGQFRSPVLHKLRERDRAACSKTSGVNASMRARVHSKSRYSYSQSREPGEAHEIPGPFAADRAHDRFCSARKTDLPNDRH